MRRHKVLMALLACWMCAAVGMTAVAVAHTVTAPSATTIRYREARGRFKGRVTSSRPKCERRRRVVLMRDTASGPRAVGRARSNRYGRWSISEPNASGTYRAVVRRRFYENQDPFHAHLCQRAQSAAITVDP